MMRRVGLIVLAIVVLAGAGGWLLSAPQRLDAKTVAGVTVSDAEAGEQVFWAGGCVSCHAAKGTSGDDRLRLAGGVELDTPFGVFVTPNISQDAKTGIGDWSFSDFANAMQRGVDPEGHHLYPAFPYTSYSRLTLDDISDLYAFMKTLPAVENTPPDDRIGFPYNIRRGIGLWKRLFLRPRPVVALDAEADDMVARGQYLVEGPGHCGECHTPRNALGALDHAQWLAGAPNPEGKGIVPNITPGDDGIASWSASDIAYYLESGFTPDFDSVGGTMVEIQENIAKLPASDRDAIAAYLKAIPPHANGYAAPDS